MSLATVELLKESWESGDNNLRTNIRYALGIGDRATFNVEHVERFLNQHLQSQLDHRLGKGVRPWDLVNMSKRLDPKQPWIGIEYETGYKLKDTYEKVINFVWQSFPLTAVDSEGCSSYPCEITFAPANFDDFISNDGDMDKLLKFMKKANCPKAPHSVRAMIGTHCNISTPKYRAFMGTAKGQQSQLRIVRMLNQGLYQMNATDKRALFGRQPYGQFYSRANRYGSWIEGKLFNSTDDIKQWRGYKEVIAKLCEVVEFLAKLEEKGKLFEYIDDGTPTNNVKIDYSYYGPPKFKYITLNNLAAVLMGKVKVADLDVVNPAGVASKAVQAAGHGQEEVYVADVRDYDHGPDDDNDFF